MRASESPFESYKSTVWNRENQLAIYECGRGFELGTTVKQIQLSNGQS